MSIQASCGPHCGITGPREGHCDCGLCHDGDAPVVITRQDLTSVVRGIPMCELQGTGYHGRTCICGAATGGRR